MAHEQQLSFVNSMYPDEAYYTSGASLALQGLFVRMPDLDPYWQDPAPAAHDEFLAAMNQYTLAERREKAERRLVEERELSDLMIQTLDDLTAA